ncbi:MAG: hypothetical protein IJ480_03695, partial [Clostridia bacterium]|nr:hypothetical protein [Clostridia bacterium]
MQNKLQQDAVKYVKRNHRRRVWRKFVRAMACVVVFCTTYALILPAITMEKTQCGLAEHTHSAGCYEKLAAEPVVTLACTYESLGVHVHNADCYDSEHNLLCGMADFLVHQHDAGCWDANGELVCRLPEIQVHEHTENCYQTVETETGHRHDDACYRLERGELTCELTETEGHTHDKTCFTQGELICRLPEQEAHTHGAGCSEQVLVCEDETESHTHTDVCWQTNSLCGLEETEGHTHASSCYESLLTCERGEEEPHTHTDDCYQQVSVLICDLEEGTLETTESAEATAPVERELICEKQIVRLHSHNDTECYEIHLDENGNEQKRLICTDTVV